MMVAAHIMNTDFENDLKTITLKSLDDLGYAGVKPDNLSLLLQKYFDILQRIPTVRRWKIKKSAAILNNKTLESETLKGLKRFICDAEAGNSLLPYLHKSILKNHKKPYDHLLYRWKIYHFHLGTNKDPRNAKYVGRTDFVLCALIEDDTLYLIDILKHDFWNQSLLKTIEQNWPNILPKYSTDTISADKFTNEQIKVLSKKNVNFATQTPAGLALLPMGGGCMVNGSSALALMEADQLVDSARKFEQWFLQQNTILESLLKENMSSLHFNLVTFDEGNRTSARKTNRYYN